MKQHGDELDEENDGKEGHEYKTNGLEVEVLVTKGPLDTQGLLLELEEEDEKDEDAVEHEEGKDGLVPEFQESVRHCFL